MTLTKTLLEREPELGQLERVLGATAAGEGDVVVVAGPAGAGKSELLRAAIGEAVGIGLRPLSAAGSELERGFAFGVARRLLEVPVLEVGEDERERLLAGAARHAAPVLVREAEAAQDLHATLHGLYWLLVNLAARSPLLVAVDDLQWVDEPSARWLVFLARRLEHLPIALVVGARTAPGSGRIEDPDPSLAAREAIWHLLERGVRLEPAPLSREAVAELAAAALEGSPDPAFVEACRRRTGGNPFLVTELLAELATERVAPVARMADLVEEVVPARVETVVDRRLGRLGERAEAVAVGAAVLGEGGSLSTVAQMAGLDLPEAATTARELAAAQILEDADRVSFRHPLLQAAVLLRMGELERSVKHGHAAQLLAQAGAPPGRVAVHLLLSAPAADPWVVDVLRAAASAAQAQGASEQAAALLRRALAEPPPAKLMSQVLDDLGSAELAGLEPSAAEHLEAALSASTDPQTCAEVALKAGVGHYYAGAHARAVRVLTEAIDEARAHPELREAMLALEAFLAIAGRYDMETEGLVRERVHRLAAELSGRTLGERMVKSVARAERPGPSARDLYLATRYGDELFGRLPWPDPAEGAGTVAMYLHAHRPDAAREVAERLAARAVEQGSPFHHALAVVARGVIALDVGDLRAAEADLREALELGGGLRGATLPPVVGYLARALSERGSAGEAERLLRHHGLSDELAEHMLVNPLLFSRGIVQMALRRYREAERDFRELGRRLERWGIERPSPPWRSACALAVLAAGNRDEAAELAAGELEAARSWDTPRAIATGRRALALAEGGESGLAGLREAVELLEGTEWRLDRARARCDLGAALRRAGWRAEGRRLLELAMDEAHACGADSLTELAADELRSSGMRPRRRAISGLDALTPSERRVAMLAASGRTNREIAQELFVTLATVETHLTRVYRKLDIAGRANLPARLVGEAR